jgi:hypothetical protein
MRGNPREMITVAERRFPVRIRIAVPPSGLAQRHTQMTAWLDENYGADGWAMTPSGMCAERCSFDLFRGGHPRECVSSAVVRCGEGRDGRRRVPSTRG